MNPLTIKVRRLTPTAILPERAYADDAGWDISYDGPPTILDPGTSRLLDTGLAVAIPPGWFGSIRDRSGMAIKGITVRAGVVDSGYSGPLKVLLRCDAAEPYGFLPGDKIAQMLILPVPDIRWLETDQLPPSRRGDTGFGSTGR